MPPKAQFSRERILDTAFTLVRRDGWGGLSARSIAKELGASTGPIYAYLSSMTDIEEAVVERALALFISYITARQTGDAWIDSGIGYVRFAQEEQQLFRCINDEKHAPMQRRLSRKIWERLGQDLVEYPMFKGMEPGLVNGIRIARWILAHGLASLLNNGWFEVDSEGISINENKQVSIETLIRTFSQALCKGMTVETVSDESDR